MARSVHRTFIAGVATAAVLLTALGASQALAGERNAERALAATLGLAVVGAIVADHRDDDRKGHVVTRDRPQYGYDRHDGRDRYDRRPAITPRPLPHRVQRQFLPRDCLQRVRTRNGGTVQVYGGRCLTRNYAFADSLPRQCARYLDGRRGDGTVWGAQCLEQNGYRVSRR